MSADPCPHLWTPPCECPLGPFHEPACAWFNPALDPADVGPREADCPAEFGPAGDEYDWSMGSDPDFWPDGSE